MDEIIKRNKAELGDIPEAAIAGIEAGLKDLEEGRVLRMRK